MALIFFFLTLLICLAAENDSSKNFQPSIGDETKVYALYFPQFHEDPINNILWGKGYTDWDNVKSAPRLNRYNEPIMRPDKSLGYYDLTNFNIRKKQRELAQSKGIDGFIYHHYWFHRLESGATLSAPLEKMLIDGEPNISFALNWALDSWLGTWSGRGKEGELLYQQLCPPSNDSRIELHYHYLKQFFHQNNYIKINGIPLFFVLRSQPHACIPTFTKLRDYAIEDGFPSPGLYILGGGKTPMSKHEVYTGRPYFTNLQIYDGDFFYPFATFPERQARIPSRCRDIVISSIGTDAKDVHSLAPKRPQYLSVMTSFDNTPRRNVDNATIWNRSFSHQGAGKSFEYDLVVIMMYERCCQSPSVRNEGGKFVVVNAWNEWGEGMVLEPSASNGTMFLDAIKNAKRIVKSIGCNWQAFSQFAHRFRTTERVKSMSSPPFFAQHT